MLERQHLHILFEVERLGSLTAAAESLCLTQSALSHAIRKLEQRLGTPLWRKDGRKLRLTQAGEHLAGVAQRLLPQFEQAEAALERLAQGRGGLLRIGVECHPCQQWLLGLVEPYLRDWPAVDVDVRQQFQFGDIGALYQHEIDVLVTPDPLYRAGLVFEPVHDYEQVLVVAADHPLATRRHVTPRQFTGETLITYPVECDRLDIYRLFLLPANCLPRRRQIIETTEIALAMVAAGRGVTALPRWLAEQYAGHLPLAMLGLGRGGLHKQIHLGLRREDRGMAYLEAFIGLARGAHPA